MELVEAELTKDEGWDEALKGVCHLAHTASPYFVSPPKGFDYITPAVEGTTRVLEAAARAGTVTNVVLTSSCAAIMGSPDSNCGQDSWTPITGENDYSQSKTCAEKAGWDWAKKNPKIKFNTVNPGCIFGKTVLGGSGGSVDLVKIILLQGQLGIMPLTNYFCDVQDCAEAHTRALGSNEAGTRFFVAEALPFVEGCKTFLEFNALGYSVAESNMNDFLVCCLFKCCKWLNPMAVEYGPLLYKYKKLDNSPTKKLLGGKFRDWKKSAIEYTHEMIRTGKVKMTAKYREKYKNELVDDLLPKKA